MGTAEAGRKGGMTTLRRYGRRYYQRIGKMGGSKGGNMTKRRHGSNFYRRIGRKGGLS